MPTDPPLNKMFGPPLEKIAADHPQPQQSSPAPQRSDNHGTQRKPRRTKNPTPKQPAPENPTAAPKTVDADHHRARNTEQTLVYLAQPLKTRVIEYRTRHQLTNGQVCARAIEDTYRDGRLQDAFDRGTTTAAESLWAPETFAPVRTIGAATTVSFSLTMLRANMTILDQLVRDIPGCPSRSALVATALELFLDDSQDR